jgi:hypothetical protein
MAHDPYDLLLWRGVTIDYFTLAWVQEVEHDLGRPIDQVYQGSYRRGVSQSAGTHDGGGALDLWDRDPHRIIRFGRNLGGAGWIRTPAQGDWVEHEHWIIGGDKKMSSEAHDQWVDYLRGGDGLSPYGQNDDYEPRPDKIHPFNYAQSQQGKWQHGEVYVKKLHRGVQNSDSVRRLQRRLLDHPKVPAKDVKITGDYGPGTVSAVMYYQREVFEAADKDFRDGVNMNNKQANQLFGDRYRVTEE